MGLRQLLGRVAGTHPHRPARGLRDELTGREIPELNGLDRRDGYRVLGVNFDGATGDELASQEEALGVEFPTLSEDPGPRFALERPEVLPRTLVLAPGGSLHRVLVGPQTVESLIGATEGPAE